MALKAIRESALHYRNRRRTPEMKNAESEIERENELTPIDFRRDETSLPAKVMMPHIKVYRLKPINVDVAPSIAYI